VVELPTRKKQAVGKGRRDSCQKDLRGGTERRWHLCIWINHIVGVKKPTTNEVERHRANKGDSWVWVQEE
jgi:hypothetical protein